VRRWPLAPFLCCAALASCSLAPTYHTPDAGKVPTTYQEQSDEWKRAQPLDAAARGAWWQVFADPKLDQLETQAQDANQTLKAAYARLRQARDDARVARADLFPTITASASATRARASPNSPHFVPGSATTGNDFIAEADLSYEVDLWGRVRNEVAAAKASSQATAADLASIKLSIGAEVASDYYGLRSQDRQLVLLDQAIEDFAHSLQLTQNLLAGGAAVVADVAQAQAQLANARTQASEVRLQRAQMQHALAVLLGQNPSSYQLAGNPLPAEQVPPLLEPGMPSSLLERRPDVAEAERRVAAANAQIGVARAAFFPRFDLIGSAGFNSVHSSNWLSAPSLFWSLGPQLAVPIFEGGRLHAQSDRARALYDEQVATYRNTVLAAYQDVEDNLAALRRLEMESQTQAQAVEANAVTLQQAQYRYQAGAVTYLEVSIAETNALQSQLAAVTIQTRRMNASVLLIKALGGGWQHTDVDLASK
jgi:NodT family efflux transporter outer membrane factor (OMF) lipoprotein